MDLMQAAADPMAPTDPTAASAASAASAATATATATAGLAIVVAGVELRLLADRAVWWPDAGTLFVADVHLGKAESFSALGVPVPRGPTAATLDRLAGLIDVCGAGRLVVLGDLLHARQAQAPATIGLLRQWRERHARLQCVLVRGNHDDHAGDPPADLGIEMVIEGERLGPFSLRHVPCEADQASSHRHSEPGGYRLAGHLHPAVRLSGRGGASLRLPCFRVGESQMVLPAFGDFTGAATIVRLRGERIFAIAPPSVIELPALLPSLGRP